MSHSLVPIRREPCATRPDVETVVRDRLNQNRPYKVYFEKISYECVDGVLKLHGNLPTFYLKQLLQTTLRDIDGVQQIDNRVDVINASGLSGGCK